MRWRANTLIGGALMALVLGTALTAAFWTPFDPLRVNLRARLQPPSSLYWLGTDEFGRDVLSRVMTGAGTSVVVALLTVAIAVSVGVVVGVVAGYLRGWTDRTIMAVNDALLAFPGILLALAMMIVLGANKSGLVLALGLAYLPSVARVVRGTVLSIREKEYIEAARALGAGPWRIMFVDILPNLLAPLIVYSTLLIPATIVGEASLSFLGVGVLPPTADWGAMISSAQSVYLYGAWWYLVFPSLALLITTLAFNIFGDGVRDAFDPRGTLFV
jgi:peptide/nickel transport system permease protein